MTRIRRITLIGIVFCSFVTGFWTAKADVGSGPTKYLKQEGSDTMPYRIVLRHCANVEDTMSWLQVVSYDPERVVYHCVTP